MTPVNPRAISNLAPGFIREMFSAVRHSTLWCCTHTAGGGDIEAHVFNVSARRGSIFCIWVRLLGWITELIRDCKEQQHTQVQTGATQLMDSGPGGALWRPGAVDSLYIYIYVFIYTYIRSLLYTWLHIKVRRESDIGCSVSEPRDTSALHTEHLIGLKAQIISNSSGCKWKSYCMKAYEKMILTWITSSVNSSLMSLRSQSIVWSLFQQSMMFTLYILDPFREK